MKEKEDIWDLKDKERMEKIGLLESNLENSEKQLKHLETKISDFNIEKQISEKKQKALV